MTQAAPPAVVPIPPLIHAFAGSLGGALALLLFYPLERARIEMQKSMSNHHPHHHHQQQQQQQQLHQQNLQIRTSNSNSSSSHSALGRGGAGGGGSLLQGSTSQHGETSPLGESWFAMDDAVASSAAACAEGDDDLTFFEDALSQFNDEAVTSSKNNPTTGTAVSTTTTTALSACIRNLWERNELYRGVSPLVLTLAASNFIFFYVNEAMKRIIFHSPVSISTTNISGPSKNNSYRSLLASCLAGICNVLLTNPLWVANLRIATGESQSSKLLREMVHVARTNGWGHLWSGTAASLLLVSNPVLQFFCYEELKQLLRLRSQSSGAAATTTTTTLPPLQAFLAGALAKAIATVVTYPLQLAQTVMRMQQHDDNENSKNDDDYRGTWDCLSQLYQTDGAKALYTGMRAKLLQTVLTAAFTFLTYEQIATALHATHQSLLANSHASRSRSSRKQML